jgi:endonuclease/exonuclease/phosphatase (EEP) superfamily protein YafD
MFVIAAQVPTLVPATSPPLHGASLTVLTLNMKFGEADAAAVVALAASSNTDIVALEELTPAALPRLAQAGLDRDFPYSVVAPSTAANGVGLFSRRPLSRMTLSNVWPSGAVAAHVELGNGLGPITVYVVHVPAPWPQRDGLWLQQLRTIPQTIADIAGPLVMAGDFNSTMEHAPFRTMLSASAMADAADVAGAGWLPTYPSDSAVPPVIAIDHVLTRGASATAVHTVTVRGSDHRAVVATLTVG